MKLILTRHGETKENITKIMQGQTPGKLSVKGIEQAKKLADRLKDEKIDFIYSSDLARAKDTTKEILKYHPNVSIKFIAELRERNLGDFQGKKESEFCSDGGDYKETFIEPPNGESMKKLYMRAESFLHKIINRHKNDTVLFIGHAGINKAITAVIMSKTYKDIWDLENPKNTSVSIFEIDEDKNHKILCFNCNKHLD